MKILTKEVLKDLGGKEIKNNENLFTVGEAIANILSGSESGGKMKLYILATKLYQDKEVEVDEADMGVIKMAIESCKTYTPLITGQLLVLLENLKETNKK